VMVLRNRSSQLRSVVTSAAAAATISATRSAIACCTFVAVAAIEIDGRGFLHLKEVGVDLAGFVKELTTPDSRLEGSRSQC
jgi:hypothetical protein